MLLKSLRRRDILRLFGVVLTVPILRYGIGEDTRSRLSSGRNLDSLMSKYPNLAALGRIYLGDHQPDSRISPTPRLETVSDMQAFQQQVSKCFCAGETVVIDGWYLSDIEAQLCVALYLLSENRLGSAS